MIWPSDPFSTLLILPLASIRGHRQHLPSDAHCTLQKEGDRNSLGIAGEPREERKTSCRESYRTYSNEGRSSSASACVTAGSEECIRRMLTNREDVEALRDTGELGGQFRGREGEMGLMGRKGKQELFATLKSEFRGVMKVVNLKYHFLVAEPSSLFDLQVSVVELGQNVSIQWCRSGQ